MRHRVPVLVPSILEDDDFDECRDLQSPDGRHKVITADHLCILCGERADPLLEHWCLLALCVNRTRELPID